MFFSCSVRSVNSVVNCIFQVEMSTSSAALLEVRALRREFPSGEGTITVLKDIDLSIRAGEMVAIVARRDRENRR